MVPHETMKFCKFWFLSSGISCISTSFCGILFYSILGLYYYHKNLWSSLCCCISNVQKQGDFFYCFYTMATLKNHYKVNAGVRQMQTADLQTGR